MSVVRFGCNGARTFLKKMFYLQMIISASQLTSLLFFAADISVLLQEETTHPWLLNSGYLCNAKHKHLVQNTITITSSLSVDIVSVFFF